MCSKTPKTIQNLNQKIESNRNKFSYYQLVFGITILFILIFLICVLQINIWVLQENNYLLNVKIEALLVEQQSEAKKNALILLKSKKSLLIAQHNEATMVFAVGCFAVATSISLAMVLLK